MAPHVTRRRAATTAAALAAALAVTAAATGTAAAAPEARARYLGDRLETAAPALGAPPFQTLTGPGVVDDLDASVVYDGPKGWATTTLNKAANGTVHTARRIGSTASIPFQGSRVIVYYVAMRGGAVLDVYLDAIDPANRIGVVNQSRSYRSGAWALHLDGLPATEEHTLILRQRTRGRVNVDAVVYRDGAAEMPAGAVAAWPPDSYPIWFSPAETFVTYAGLWSTWDGRIANSWRRGDKATFSFTGDSFILYMWMDRRNRKLGRMRVLIDGQPAFKYRVINQRRARKRGWWLYQWTNIGDGTPQPHTITLRHARGTKVNFKGINAFLDVP